MSNRVLYDSIDVFSLKHCVDKHFRQKVTYFNVKKLGNTTM